MNTNSDKNKTSIEQLLISQSIDEQIEFEAQMIQLDFIAKVRELMEIKGIRSKKELADKLETSPSYITQLFSADKLMNFKLLAKLQRIFETKFNLIPDIPERYLKSQQQFWSSKNIYSKKLTYDINTDNNSDDNNNREAA